MLQPISGIFNRRHWIGAYVIQGHGPTSIVTTAHRKIEKSAVLGELSEEVVARRLLGDLVNHLLL